MIRIPRLLIIWLICFSSLYLHDWITTGYGGDTDNDKGETIEWKPLMNDSKVIGLSNYKPYNSYNIDKESILYNIECGDMTSMAISKLYKKCMKDQRYLSFLHRLYSQGYV